MMTPEIKKLILDSTEIEYKSKKALIYYIESQADLGINVEEYLDLDRASKIERINEEIRTRFDFDKSRFKNTYMGARLTRDLLDKPVFARAIENKYFEQITSYNRYTREFSYENFRPPADIEKFIQNFSNTITIDKNELIRKGDSLLRAIIEISNNGITNISNIEHDIIERICVDLFVSNYNVFYEFMININNIDNLSSVIFSGITFKICTKLAPLLAAKFVLNHNTDESLKKFFEKIFRKTKIQAYFLTRTLDRTRLFLYDHSRIVTVSTLGITLFSLVSNRNCSENCPRSGSSGFQRCNGRN